MVDRSRSSLQRGKLDVVSPETTSAIEGILTVPQVKLHGILQSVLPLLQSNSLSQEVGS